MLRQNGLDSAGNLWYSFICTLGCSLAVGHVTLTHAVLVQLQPAQPKLPRGSAGVFLISSLLFTIHLPASMFSQTIRHREEVLPLFASAKSDFNKKSEGAGERHDRMCIA